MFLDLTSTIVGSLGTIIIIFLFMLWVVMSAGKEAETDMEKTNGNHCPFRGEKLVCNPYECKGWERCERLEARFIKEWRA